MSNGSTNEAEGKGTAGQAPSGRKRPGGRFAQKSDVATPSQTFPFLAMLPDLARKGFLIPTIATAVATAAAFIATNLYHDPAIFAWVIGAYFTFLGVASVYALCGKRKSWLALLIVCVLMICMMRLGADHSLVNVTLDTYLNALDHIGLPHNTRPAPGGLIVKILQTCVAVGLFEEGIKIVPVALFALLAWQLTPGPNSSRPLAAPLNRLLRIRGIGWIIDGLLVREPIDAILLAAASAAGFELVESLVVYQATAANNSYENIMGVISQEPLWNDLVKAIHAASPALNKQFDELSSFLASGHMSLNALMSTIVRTIDSPFGHIAFSGCVAYGIGLAMLRPGSALKVIGLYAAIGIGLHSILDAVIYQFPDQRVLSALWPGVWALVAYAFLGTLILKARQISPTRASNFASVTPQHRGMSDHQAPPQPTYAQPASGSRVAFLLALPNGSVELRPSLRLTEQQLGYGGSAIAAEVNHSPHDARILGLKNLSAVPWTVTLPDGTRHTVALDRSMRLIEGMTILFGTTVGRVRGP
jgi:RsiW-degrading membrane proteinase PrsW (M82 family)